MNRNILYFDCFSGASGDMLLGALVALGVPVEELEADVAALGCEPISLTAERASRGGIAATKVHVRLSAKDAGHRGLAKIVKMISASRLSDTVKDRAVAVFERLAHAEAEVHGLPVEKVHFHEVGALDAIADIVGSVCGLERLGNPEIRFSRLRLGGGAVKCAHGLLPVPAPATAKLVEGLVCEMGPVEVELLTPTAAAILATLGQQDVAPAFRVLRTGYGAGDRDTPEVPNVLRAVLAETVPAETPETAVLLEANIDDATPEILAHALDRVLAAGALDAWIAPIQMKKSRPGFQFCALTAEHLRERVERIIFAETTTFGIRRRRVERATLDREIVSVESRYGPVSVKVGSRDGEALTASPEFEDCRRLAVEHGIPLRRVMDAAREAFARMRRT